jgi:RNA polymerase sigma-70 factor, ECF subfamily
MAFSDEQLIERYLGGETEAFNELVRKWECRVYNFALRFCSSREDAEDISQEAFAAVMERVGELRDRRLFPSWLYKIVLNLCRMRHRSSVGRQQVPLASAGSEVSDEVESKLAGARAGESPENHLIQKDLGRYLRSAMQSLSEEQRTVVLLKEYEGLKFHEIAAILDCPLSTVKSRLYLGLQAMRTLLERQGIGL